MSEANVANIDPQPTINTNSCFRISTSFLVRRLQTRDQNKTLNTCYTDIASTLKGIMVIFVFSPTVAYLLV